jgi:hypothetical protein
MMRIMCEDFANSDADLEDESCRLRALAAIDQPPVAQHTNLGRYC